jgi:hypothetical protein
MFPGGVLIEAGHEEENTASDIVKGLQRKAQLTATAKSPTTEPERVQS